MIRNQLDSAISGPVCRDVVSYERDPLEDNKYHGNILMNLDAINKPHQDALFEQLASTISERIPLT